MKWLNIGKVRTRRANQPGSIPVVGGPYDGRRVREIVTTPEGAWILDRAYLCKPPERRRPPHDSYPYRLQDGAYVWNQQGDDDERHE